MIKIRTLDGLAISRGTRVFYRVDYNVPIDAGTISDATRIEETIPTLRRLLQSGAAVIVAAHLGRPKGKRSEKDSLAPVRARLAEVLGIEVEWAADCVGEATETQASALAPGHVLLLENLRFHAGEEANDPAFAAQLRKLAGVYVNDAFGACHRAHASIAALPRLFPTAATAGGLLMEKELNFLQQITNVSERPFVALLGGAKIAGKIEPLEALVNLADTILIGGGMANTFLAAEGVEMGGSLVDRESMDVATRILNGRFRAGVKLPVDLVVGDDLKSPRVVETVSVSQGLSAAQKAFDIGPKTVTAYRTALDGAKTVFWNGPMGVFEQPQFAKGTMAMAQAVANVDGVTVVGGGESVEAIKASGVAGRISHISTGGGASLEFIAGAMLPGVEVLKA